MSILNVSHVSHGFGGRQILQDVSFRLLKGEHIGLVGANGEGKSTFLNILTGELSPDDGTVEWCNHITTGYLDQYSTLKEGMSIREVLRAAFSNMYKLEAEILELYDKMANCQPEQMDAL
ncbi:MAG: ATP-binding cassette domain-containing protein, partial [Clostridia bacterium]